MISDSIENSSPARDAEQAKARRKPNKKAQAAKKPARKTTSKAKAEGTKKKAEVIALMKRAKGNSRASSRLACNDQGDAGTDTLCSSRY